MVTFMYPPYPLTETTVTEYYEEIEERIASCDRIIPAFKQYCREYPNSPRLVVAHNAIEKYTRLRRVWLEEQLRCEEWLIDHEAKGWVST